MNILEEIFHIYEERNRSKAVDESWKKCRAGLHMIPDCSIDTVANLIHGYAGECERTGFVNGFYLGVRLIIECMSKGGASNG